MRIEGVKVLGRGRAAPIKYSVFPCAEHSDEPHRTGSMPPEDDTCLLYTSLSTYSSTVTPILLHVPAIMLIAASKEPAFKSGIFNSAISCNFALEMVATLSFCGTAEPDLMLHALSLIHILCHNRYQGNVLTGLR